MSGRRGPRVHVARGAVVAAVATSLALTVVGVAQRIPAQAISRQPTKTLTISAAVPTTVCPGPQSLAVPDGAKPVNVPGPVELNAVSLAAANLADLAAPSSSGAPTAAHPVPLSGSGSVWLGATTRSKGGAVRLDVQAAAAGGNAVAGAGALQTSFGVSGDLRGVDALVCAPAVGSAWLVGGATTDGDRLKLLLANPTVTTAVADVVVHGADGDVTAPGTEGVVVPAGKQVAFLVDAIAPGIAAPAVEVTARTGRVVAHLQHQRLRGFTAAGVDDIVPASAPATTQVVPGLVVSPPGTAAVRIAVPGKVDAVVRVALLGLAGQVPLADGVVNIPAGGVRDVPLNQVPAGVYSAVVSADVPVVAAGSSSVTLPGGETAGTPAALGKNVPPSELAWIPGAAALRGMIALPLPAGTAAGRGALTSTLVFATAEFSAKVGLREVQANGTVGPERVIEIPARRTVSQVVAPTVAAVLIRAPGEPGTGGPAYASLVLQAKDAAGPMISTAAVPAGPDVVVRSPHLIYDPAIGVAGSVGDR